MSFFDFSLNKMFAFTTDTDQHFHHDLFCKMDTVPASIWKASQLDTVVIVVLSFKSSTCAGIALAGEEPRCPDSNGDSLEGGPREFSELERRVYKNVQRMLDQFD